MADRAKAGQDYTFEWVAAEDDLVPYLNSLYIVRVGEKEVADIMPAYSGQLLAVLEGEASMAFYDGSVAATGPVGLMCPLTQAHAFAMRPGTVVLGLSLNFLGWAALTGLPVDSHSDCYVTAEDAMGAQFAEACGTIVERAKNGELSARDALQELAAIVSATIKELPERHAQVIGQTLEWLSSSFKPEIATLLEKLPYSERQVQRLVTKFFGQPPVRLIRRYRAIRAATILSMPDLQEKLEEEVRDAFYDQAHMIKEIRHFTGRTPRRLQPKVDSVVKEMLGEPGYGSVDLFGGTQDRELGKSG